MKEVRVPNYTVKDNVVRLECHYDMEDDKLYSVKWYKDGHEFYRYLPRDHPPASLFDLAGISVDVSIPFYLIMIKFYLNLNFPLALQLIRHSSSFESSKSCLNGPI